LGFYIKNKTFVVNSKKDLKDLKKYIEANGYKIKSNFNLKSIIFQNKNNLTKFNKKYEK